MRSIVVHPTVIRFDFDFRRVAPSGMSKPVPVAGGDIFTPCAGIAGPPASLNGWPCA